MSTLVGIAIAEGRLHLDDRLAHLLPRQAAAMTPRVARVTLRSSAP
jgi:CubicO group peptidase (beta-lactamase class C family)